MIPSRWPLTRSPWWECGQGSARPRRSYHVAAMSRVNSRPGYRRCTSACTRGGGSSDVRTSSAICRRESFPGSASHCAHLVAIALGIRVKLQHWSGSPADSARIFRFWTPPMAGAIVATSQQPRFVAPLKASTGPAVRAGAPTMVPAGLLGRPRLRRTPTAVAEGRRQASLPAS
jgi:hypothetical protein